MNFTLDRIYGKIILIELDIPFVTYLNSIHVNNPNDWGLYQKRNATLPYPIPFCSF